MPSSLVTWVEKRFMMERLMERVIEDDKNLILVGSDLACQERMVKRESPPKIPAES